jgi:hypothetical protein
MTNRFLVSVAAVALIAGASAANAQGTTNRDSGSGAATQQGVPPSSGGSTGGATTQKSTEPSSGMKSTQSDQTSPGTAKGQHAQEPGLKSKNQSTENEPKAGAKEMKAEGRDGRDKTMKAEGQDKNQDKSMDKNMKAEGREGRDTDTNAQRTDERSQVTTGQAGAGAKLSTDQRTKITTVIRNERVAPVNNVDFQISIGTRVPRERISLRPLPAEVITIYPQWRGYEFFLVRDQIVVVDPRTGAIVDILPV